MATRDRTRSRARWESALPLAALVAVIPGLLGASADSGDAVPGGDVAELLERAFHNLYADDYIQTLTLATRARGGNPMTRRLQITRKQSVQPGKALVRFLAPYQIRKTSVLILERDGRSDDLYVYLPAIGRTRHLSGSQRGDSFFGTDLSYEDVEPKQAGDYRVRPVGSEEVGGLTCSLLEIRPRPDFESTYERMVSCVEPRRALILWTDFYRRGKVVKRLEVDPGSVREIGTKFIPFSMTVKTPRQRSETLVSTEVVLPALE